MKQDRFLIAVVSVILVLIIASLTIFFLRNDKQTYRPEDTPQGIVYNYLLALERSDYQRAFEYIVDEENKGTFDEFQDAYLAQQRAISTIAISIGSTDRTGDKAAVTLYLNHSGNGPFGSGWRETGTAVLTQNPTGEWKISNMPYPFWPPNLYPMKVPTP
jgi:hypothetical protein